jgi:hypothetical protein
VLTDWAAMYAASPQMGQMQRACLLNVVGLC